MTGECEENSSATRRTTLKYSSISHAIFGMVSRRPARYKSAYLPRVRHARHVIPARFRPDLAWPGTDAGAEHDLSGLAFDNARRRSRHRVARRRGTGLCVLHAVRGI